MGSMKTTTQTEAQARSDLFYVLQDAQVNDGNYHVEWNAELDLYGIWAGGDIIGNGSTIAAACRDAIRTVEGWS